jgi:hypothetical protein
METINDNIRYRDGHRCRRSAALCVRAHVRFWHLADIVTLRSDIRTASGSDLAASLCPGLRFGAASPGAGR